MQKFRIYQPTELFFGAGSLAEFMEAISKKGKKALLVTGGSSVQRLGYLKQVWENLETKGIEVVHFSGIEPNPHANTIDKAAKEGIEKGVDMVIALGGGSVMDASKGIAALIYMKEENIWEYVLGSPKAGKLTGAVPVITIPTTAATASEITPYAVISHPEVNGKSVIGEDFLKPKVSWMNPAYTKSLGIRTTQDGAADIMSHVLENYLLGGNDSPIADRHTEMVLLTVMETLPALMKDPNNINLRADLFWASDIALNGYQLAGRTPSQFVLHSMEHAASGFYPELSHGRGLATLYPAYLRWLYQKGRAHERLAKLADRLFCLTAEQEADAAMLFIEHFENWLGNNDLLQSFEDLGLKPSDYPAIAEYAVTVYGDGEKLQALGDLTKEDIVDIFKDTARQSKKEMA